MSQAPLPPKLYFRIGEVASLVGVEPHVLRYWEREFRTIRPTKSARGQRVYSRRDVENLLRVRELLYTQGFTIAGARKQLHRPTSKDEPAAETPQNAAPSAGGTKPPAAAAPEGEDPPREEETMRGTLVALREEVATFLDELA